MAGKPRRGDSAAATTVAEYRIEGTDESIRGDISGITLEG